MANGKRRINLNKRLSSFLKGLIVYALIALAALMLFYQVSGPPPSGSEVPISQIISQIKDGKAAKVSIEGDKITAEVKNSDQKLVSRKEPSDSMYKILQSSGVDPKTVTIEVKDLSFQQAWIGIISAILPILLLVGLMFFLFRNAREGAQGIFSFAQSRARLFTKDQPQIKFTDVAGAEEAKRELVEVVEFLKTPDKFKALGARIPKGVLLVGPAGTGKTLISRAVAGEAGVPFYSIAGSEFMEMLVGVGASVTGDTPILIKDQDGVRLMPIGHFVDKYYQKEEEGVIKRVENIQTLGFNNRKTGFWGTNGNSKLVFDSSGWKNVSSVFRHQVSEIYEIEYLGGKLTTTGDHSVFVRRQGWIEAKKVDELKKDDLLVELPLNIRHWDSQNQKTVHRIKAHIFADVEPLYLDFWNNDVLLQERYNYVLANVGGLSSYQLASEVGVCQTTVLNWQNGKHLPQALSKKLVKLDLPDKVSVTAKLMKLFGYYSAEGRSTGSLELTFGTKEKDLHQDFINLMRDVFGVNPVIVETEDNSTRIKYYSHHLGRFFARSCGNGSHNKHIPELLWQLPKEYFLAFLEGYSKGDGYIAKSGKLCMSSVSKQLIQELAWLCSMHGIKIGIKHELIKGGRVIKTRPLPDSEVWTLIIGKTANPFLSQSKYPNQFKRTIVKKVTKKKYDGFVYDLCGVENEAFFGGQKPVLLHNSRVRDMFAQAKKNSPAIIFIDEIESIGRQRGMGFSGGHDEREQTLNQILVEMDGFTPNERVIVLAASVTGDTPILVKENDEVSLVPIGQLIDQYYQKDEEGFEKSVEGIETLGFDKKIISTNDSRLYFQNSAFKKVRSVFRHKVKEIYQIIYLGGKVKTTGNHSVFVRTNQGIVPKQVSEIKKGDILVNLPLKVNRTNKNLRELRSHKFNEDFNLTLSVYRYDDQDAMWEQKYIFAQTNYDHLSQAQIGTQIGVSQTTVGNWLRGVFLPREISRNYFNHKLPEQVEVTPELCRLFGYYVAEGYGRKGVDFCFNKKETYLISDVKNLMENIFRLKPDRERYITDNAVNVIYYFTPIGQWFIKYCGKGAKNKHIPPFLFEAPKEYFIEFIKGLLLGDGYVDKRGRGEITSVSKQLILELNWLCRMHGIKSYIHSFVTKQGRVIKNGKPLPASVAYRLGFGKYNNPFITLGGGKDNPFKRAIVQEVKKIPYDGFVYDLCGVEDEAFFGGESPILLHNTNRPDLLDAALVRPGRFDRRVTLSLPDLEERKAIIELHMKGKPFTKEVSIERLARRTVGFSGADLANMLNEAAILAAREGKKAIDNKDLEEAATKEKLGPQRKRMQSDRDRKLAAYHEAGHAIVGHFLKNVDPVHRISIVARGISGGHTMFPPTEDRSNETKSRLMEQITAALGGQAAEEMIFKDISTGAASDISIATQIARQMVMEYGMSSLGPMTLQPKSMFGIWRGMDDSGDMSPNLHNAVDKEVKKIMDQSFKLAQKILKEHKASLDKVAKALLEKETLESDEFEKIVGKKKS